LFGVAVGVDSFAFLAAFSFSSLWAFKDFLLTVRLVVSFSIAQVTVVV
jgi:hypothetical protein